MQWTEMQKNWKNVQTQFQTKWNKLTTDDLKAIAGNRDELLKRLHTHYKTDKTKLDKEVDEFVKGFKPTKV